MFHACLGEEDRALLWLEKAREERDPWLPYCELWIIGFNVIGLSTRYLTSAKRAAFVASLGIVRA